MKSKDTVELNWTGKDEPFLLEPRILLHRPEQSYKHGDGVTDNLLVYGDNLPVLKELERDYIGKIKCVYIDPPYNTKSKFNHYDDNRGHVGWLNFMNPRLDLLRRLLRDDGSIWISIDDSECHYLKVLCDEVFGRSNFLSNVVWQHSVQGKGYSGRFSLHHNSILVYRKSTQFKLSNLERTDENNKNYSNPDGDPKGAWRSGDVRSPLVRPNLMYDIATPSGKTIAHPEKGWRFSMETFLKELVVGKIVFSQDETRIIRKIYLAEQNGRVPETIWFSKDVGATREATREVKSFNSEDIFQTPKPERLLERILHLATEPGDIVLDSFAGSGTTGAVSQKMGRRWIMIELGDHCHTHIMPRLQQVIDGTDQGGISKAVDWKGGGGYRYAELSKDVNSQPPFFS